MASPKPKSFAFGWSELSLIIPFLLGILVYNGFKPMVRDWLVVEPAIARAKAFAAQGAEPAALPILLDQAASDARNPKLLWALGDIYAKLDQPVLARFYFQALARRSGNERLDPQQRAVAQKWQDNDATVMLEVRRELKEIENQYKSVALTYSTSINQVLNRPAAEVDASSGYFQPDYPVPCGKDRPRCGYKFQFGTGNLWDAIATQKLKIAFSYGGPDCCVLALSDPDLRSRALVEMDYASRHENLNEEFSPLTRAAAAAHLAFRARVLTKQLYVLGFADEASIDKPKFDWTPRIWVELIAWLAIVAAVREAVMRYLARRRSATEKNQHEN